MLQMENMYQFNQLNVDYPDLNQFIDLRSLKPDDVACILSSGYGNKDNCSYIIGTHNLLPGVSVREDKRVFLINSNDDRLIAVHKGTFPMIILDNYISFMNIRYYNREVLNTIGVFVNEDYDENIAKLLFKSCFRLKIKCIIINPEGRLALEKSKCYNFYKKVIIKY